MFFDFKKNKDWIGNLSIVTQLGLSMAGCIFFCFFVGRYLDRFFGTRGIFVAIFTVLGVIGGGVVVYRQILEVTEVEKEDNNDSDNGSA
ncbi:MAG: AtpZ/AtpI family protein [Proteobacteria bacterium]|nr:AtpZ/AtpI family protein [Pseudomonadota bacterium]